ncbi:helix-turn-helix domain-containing protein [Chitinophaga cymbidii]|uniref:HTH cro/C1-type domain-containing protein n=1 Tax=Chitinophaga cymbidii TaxID=1096750 RepID=A0A512RNG4_9BACT|nr:helix-turn-helix transcriptional regulator [Chitinophaga cymbidii]GEP97233.1 hypothetical protein CCY01nite_34930 [Chitinophaga cymbidii]
MEREELLRSREYWTTKIRLDLYKLLEDHKRANHLTVEQLAQQLGVTKGYVSQILNGDADHKISKLVELALMCGKVPVISYEDTDQYIIDDMRGKQDEDRPVVHLNLETASVKSGGNISIGEDAVF